MGWVLNTVQRDEKTISKRVPGLITRRSGQACDSSGVSCGLNGNVLFIERCEDGPPRG